MTETVFELTNAGKSFGDIEVLSDINLTVIEGQRVAVIGPSGAGKTTLFRLLNASIRPTVGEVRSLGFDTRRLRGRVLRTLRCDIGFLYQNDNLISHLRVIHNVLMGKLGRWTLPASVLSLLWPWSLGAAREALDEVELAHKLWSMPGELSGGQQQRVAIARLLVQKPRVMMADEPVSQLDIRLGREIVELLLRVSDRLKSTLLVNLHTLELLTGFDRVIALREGELFWQGKPDGLNRDMLRELYGAEYRALQMEELDLTEANA